MCLDLAFMQFFFFFSSSSPLSPTSVNMLPWDTKGTVLNEIFATEDSDFDSGNCTTSSLSVSK